MYDQPRVKRDATKGKCEFRKRVSPVCPPLFLSAGYVFSIRTLIGRCAVLSRPRTSGKPPPRSGGILGAEPLA